MKRIALLLALLLVFCCACSKGDRMKERKETADVFVDFTEDVSNAFYPSDGWTNGDPFNCFWRRDNCVIENGLLKLRIDGPTSANSLYYGGEYRSAEFFGYGKFEVCMKAIKNDGVVSSFFTYTGPSDQNPWDEIDIEFLGKETTKVQFNYFTDGVSGHEMLYDLGFDASEAFHVYGFEWHEDKIVWYVDDEPVYTATENLPVTPGKLMMNAWCGKGVDDWLAPFDDSNLPLTAEYRWFSFTAFH